MSDSGRIILLQRRKGDRDVGLDWGIGLLLMGVAIGSSAKRVAEDFQNVLRVMRKSSAPFLTP